MAPSKKRAGEEKHRKRVIRNKTKVLNKQFRKRSGSVFRKVNQLWLLTEARIYLVMCQNEQVYIYKSTDQPGWPPLGADIVSHLT